MADDRVEQRLKEFQIHRPDVDLSEPRRTTHAQYWHNLHVVLVNDGRYMEVRDEVLDLVHHMILDVSAAKGHLLSRAAIVPDHIHLTLGCGLNESPEEVVLSYMNNLAHVCGLKEVFNYSYYVGTFSEYDIGVIPSVVQNHALHRAELGGGVCTRGSVR